MIFPEHKCGLHLTHNNHKDYYESVEQYLENPWMKDCNLHPEERQAMIEANEVWELQWYPETPIGSYKVIGADLELVLTKALEIDKENKTPDEQS